MGCLTNMKGIAVISSKSAIALGSVAVALALPPPLVPGVAGTGAAAVLPAIVTSMTLSKK